MDPFLFIALLAGLAILIVALAHASIIAQELVRNKKAANPKQDSATRVKPEGLSPDFAALIDTIAQQGQATRAEEKREDDKQETREWLTICLLITTIILLGWQVSEMVKVYGPIEDQAKAAIRTAENSRAWVGPTNVAFDIEPDIGKSVDVTVFYNNFGHDPGTGFVPKIDAFISPLSDPTVEFINTTKFFADCKESNRWDGGSVVYPAAINRPVAKVPVHRCASA